MIGILVHEHCMRIHIVFFCPRCGYQSFRSSVSRVRKDFILRMLGVYPHRCYICKVRFYLFRPSILRTLASPIETSAAVGLSATARSRNAQSAALAETDILKKILSSTAPNLIVPIRL